MSNSFDPDQAKCLVRPDLGTNCLHGHQQTAKHVTNRLRVQEFKEIKSATMIIFLFFFISFLNHL